MVVQTDFGYWVEDAVSDFKVKPDEDYNIRIIRQPQRITVFIDGKQIMSHRVRNIDNRHDPADLTPASRSWGRATRKPYENRSLKKILRIGWPRSADRELDREIPV